MEKKDRLAKALAYLKMKGLAESQVDAARKMNAAESTMSSAMSGNEKYLNNKFLKRFNDAFGDIFSLDWLINGTEPMLCCYRNTSPEAPFLLGESEPGTSRTEQEKDDRIRFLEQQLKLEKDKSALLQQQLNLYEGRV
jgi:hypothetical protein